MKGKVGLVIGLSVGYVLGSRAGRERYEQIKTQWLKVWHLDPVQRQVVKAQTFATSAALAVPGVLWEGAKRVGTAIVTQQQSEKSGSSDVLGAVRETADALGDVVEDAAEEADHAADAVGKAQKPAAAKPAAAKSSKTAASKPSKADGK